MQTDKMLEVESIFIHEGNLVLLDERGNRHTLKIVNGSGYYIDLVVKPDIPLTPSQDLPASDLKV